MNFVGILFVFRHCIVFCYNSGIINHPVYITQFGCPRIYRPGAWVVTFANTIIGKSASLIYTVRAANSSTNYNILLAWSITPKYNFGERRKLCSKIRGIKKTRKWVKKWRQPTKREHLDVHWWVSQPFMVTMNSMSRYYHNTIYEEYLSSRLFLSWLYISHILPNKNLDHHRVIFRIRNLALNQQKQMGIKRR